VCDYRCRQQLTEMLGCSPLVYWFIGHSVMYVVLAVFFGKSMIEQRMPALNVAGQKRSAVEDLLVVSPSGVAFAQLATPVGAPCVRVHSRRLRAS
jgi:hypothetical protein